MKKIFFYRVLNGTLCYGQDAHVINQQDTAIAYTGIVNIDSISKEELFIRARDLRNP